MTDENRVFGIRPVAALLDESPESVRRLRVQRGRDERRISSILQQAFDHGIAVERVERDELERDFPGCRHQGIAADFAAAKTWSEHDLYQQFDALAEPPLLLILDGVQDPHNLGACFRIAAAVGVHAIVAPKDRAVGLTASVRQVAAGTAGRVPFITVVNLSRFLRDLAARGVWIVGTDGAAENTLYEADLAGPLALVMGGEGKGMRRLTRSHCDALIRIPMRPSVESLNVAVAAGVCLYEAYRQRDLAIA
ncbi:MAG: 23S rRNA (guanosine(2251)-2'-O)-methyltransferase RlmB [Pseudomonadota bacterium]|nr:23S rRNA (guanosine(2251)-2'-O)-methyltransferase RlmB [Pseudomonadota bacterium]